MDDFQKAVVDALNKMVESQQLSNTRLERILEHWDSNSVRAERHAEIEERHIYLREKEHAEKFATDVRNEAVRVTNTAMQNQAWMLDIETRKALQVKLAELDEAETKRQERRAQREAETPKASAE